MHPELDTFIRQLLGVVLLTVLPLAYLVFLHTPEHPFPSQNPTVSQARIAPRAQIGPEA